MTDRVPCLLTWTPKLKLKIYLYIGVHVTDHSRVRQSIVTCTLNQSVKIPWNQSQLYIDLAQRLLPVIRLLSKQSINYSIHPFTRSFTYSCIHSFNSFTYSSIHPCIPNECLLHLHLHPSIRS